MSLISYVGTEKYVCARRTTAIVENTIIQVYKVHPKVSVLVRRFVPAVCAAETLMNACYSNQSYTPGPLSTCVVFVQDRCSEEIRSPDMVR